MQKLNLRREYSSEVMVRNFMKELDVIFVVFAIIFPIINLGEGEGEGEGGREGREIAFTQLLTILTVAANKITEALTLEPRPRGLACSAVGARRGSTVFIFLAAGCR